MNSLLTQSYKGGYIHTAMRNDGTLKVDAQYQPFPTISVKSVLSAKQYITRTERNLRGLFLAYSNGSDGLQSFADSKGISVEDVHTILTRGRDLHEAYVAGLKS